MKTRNVVWVLGAGLMAATAMLGAAGIRPERYAILLDTPPLAEVISSKADLRSAAAVGQQRTIAAQQGSVRSAALAHGVHLIGSTTLLSNTVFVKATPEQVEQLKSLPGVLKVQRLDPIRRRLDRALDLVNAPAAWSVLGGASNAGAGVKIAVLDSGIDITHPAFQSAGLTAPAGFPKCNVDTDCQKYTNGKVIAARSYVSTLVGPEEPAYSRPDDVSARDRIGHGTAVAMVAAGGSARGPAATIQGVAPRAWLGNYKIVGSPGVNDFTFPDIIQMALDDAVRDGMDVAVIPYGSSALFSPTDDFRSSLVDNASRLGMSVVVPAGNSGDTGIEVPTLGSIETPGIANSAITVGATTNSHILYQTVYVTGTGVPQNLTAINALFGNGPLPEPPLTAPLRDVTSTGDNGKACSPMTNNSLLGTIALILRGDCTFDVKVLNAQKAGAVGAVIYNQTSDFIIPSTGLEQTGIPMVLIGAAAGTALKSFVAANPGRPVTLDPAQVPVDAAPDEVAYFSSQGPRIGDLAIKPELVAVGTDLYMATQNYDPNSELYSKSGYTAAQGTSFAAPMVAGAVALVKQRNSGFTPAQLKSAVVNTASPNGIKDYDYTGNPVIPARVTAVGAGKLNAGAAVQTNLTVDPVTVSFGDVSQRLPTVQLNFRNTSSGTLTLRFTVQQRDSDNNARVTLSATSLGLGPGALGNIAVSLTGRTPSPGAYEGAIVIDGGAVQLRVPYLYMVGDGVPFNIFPLRGFDFVGNAGEPVPGGTCFDAAPGGCIAFKVVDRYGVPVRNAAVRFAVTLGNGRIERGENVTDNLGIAAGRAILGLQLGFQEFSATATAGGTSKTVYFSGRARLAPIIQTDGIVNAGSGQAGPIAPGSYITILGRGLAETARSFQVPGLPPTPYLPLALAGVSVSFDAPGQRSYPGRVSYVSDAQVNVQVPWELAGLNSAQVKVSLGDFSTPLYTVSIGSASPAFFEYPDPTGPFMIAALDANYALIGAANPARRGAAVQLYANGLGPVSNTPPTGEVALASPLSTCLSKPEVTIGGRSADVLFCGLTPGNVGLYQVNVMVPADSPTGLQQVVMSTGGTTAKTANLAVQ